MQCACTTHLSTPMQLGVEVGHLSYVVGDHHQQRQGEVFLLRHKYGLYMVYSTDVIRM